MSFSQGNTQNLGLLRDAYEGDINRLRGVLVPEKLRSVRDPQTGFTLLHIAVGTNNLELLRFLLEEVNVPFTPDARGRWPSLIAAECGASEALNDYLVEKESAFIDSQAEKESALVDSKAEAAFLRRLLEGLEPRQPYELYEQPQKDKPGRQTPGNFPPKR